MGPAMQFEVPFGGEGLVADYAEVGTFPAVSEEVGAEVCSEVHLELIIIMALYSPLHIVCNTENR